jgi:hypothetical protein
MIVLRQQKVLVTGNESYKDVQEKIDKILENGWFIVSVTARHISTGGGSHLRGGYLIVFERTIMSSKFFY